jgi:Ala-tRNA(Pro) deacylase
MKTIMNDVNQFLSANNIEFTLHEHPAVYTCEEAEKHCGDIPGIACKNLLLRNKKGKRYFLVVLPAKKQTDLKKFANIVGENKISFASSELLKEKLGLEPGAVSPFGLINDTNKSVEVYIDSDIYNAETVSFHPNVNTATLELSKDMFRKFLRAIEHKITVIDL